MKYEPKHLREEPAQKPSGDGLFPDERPEQPPEHVHPLGIPFPEPDGGGEVVPLPGESTVPTGSNIAPNGAVIRNPWSQQPEIEPDNAYTPEQEDLNLLIL